MFVASVAAACCMPDVANAAIETVGGSFAPVMTPYNNQSIAIEQFDTALGTLESVTIRADGSGYFAQWYQNTSTAFNNVEVSQSLQMTLSVGLNNILTFGQSINQSHLLAAYDGSGYFTGVSGAWGTQNYAITAQDQSVLTSPSYLSLFTGTGFTGLNLSASAFGRATDSNGNFFGGWQTLAGAELTVSYQYSAVPEPSTWLAGVFAVGYLLFFARRNQLLDNHL